MSWFAYPVRIVYCLIILFNRLPRLGKRYCFSLRERLHTHKSKRKAMNRNWSNQKANPALNTKAGNK